jgi:hypothetical protein
MKYGVQHTEINSRGREKARGMQPMEINMYLLGFYVKVQAHELHVLRITAFLDFVYRPEF